MTQSRAKAAVQAPLGNWRKRGSFASLISELEERQSKQDTPLSSAAFRAGSIVRMMRKANGLSQAALAEGLRVAQSRISEIEAGAGSQGPSWDLMERIAKVCNATILVSPSESDIALDVAEPENADKHWTLVAAAG